MFDTGDSSTEQIFGGFVVNWSVLSFPRVALRDPGFTDSVEEGDASLFECGAVGHVAYRDVVFYRSIRLGLADARDYT